MGKSSNLYAIYSVFTPLSRYLYVLKYVFFFIRLPVLILIGLFT